MFVVEQTQPHTSQVGGVPEKERTVLQLPQDKYSVICPTYALASTLRARSTLIADCLTLHNILLFATAFTLR
jgi:hypothetical protein